MLAVKDGDEKSKLCVVISSSWINYSERSRTIVTCALLSRVRQRTCYCRRLVVSPHCFIFMFKRRTYDRSGKDVQTAFCSVHIQLYSLVNYSQRSCVAYMPRYTRGIVSRSSCHSFSRRSARNVYALYATCGRFRSFRYRDSLTPSRRMVLLACMRNSRLLTRMRASAFCFYLPFIRSIICMHA